MKRLAIRVPLRERPVAALLALLATAWFFYEYLPPFKQVHLFSDIEGFHYPLERYAFQSLKDGRLPQWDPSIYCGIPFAGNIQAALFYPPRWLMYAASWRFERLPFKMVEAFAIGHIWLGFMLCFLWLRGRRLDALPAVLGAAVFGFGGYMVSQIVHLGVVTGLAWMPLGLWGVDEAVERRDWRPLWKTALGSAMSFLAGYPASWLAFCVTVFLYGLASRERWRAAAGVCAAIVGSCLLAMVEWLPAITSTSRMLKGEKYGGGITSWDELLPFFVPNWFDFNFHSTAPYPDAMYLYVGLPGIFAAVWILGRRRVRPYVQALVPAVICLLLAANPRDLAYSVVSRIGFLESVAQSYNFYEGVAAMAALITAIALQDFLGSGTGRSAPRWAMPVALIALAAWSARELQAGLNGGVFPSGTRALEETAVGAVLFAVGMWAVRGASGDRRAWMAMALVLAAFVDYRVFGSHRRFNTGDGDADLVEDRQGIRGINAVAYQALSSNRDYRIAGDEQASPYSTDLRRWRLATPQGFDPMLPAQYHERIERWVKFQTNRLFFVDVKNEDMLQTLGVRYVISHEGMANDPYLSASPLFQRIGPDTFYRVYDYRHARTPYGWEDRVEDLRPLVWKPELRVFLTNSERGGRFYLAEQFFPGWSAMVDGKAAPIERWQGTFQAIDVGPGKHTIVFRYLTQGLREGALISMIGVELLVVMIILDRRTRPAAAAAAAGTVVVDLSWGMERRR